MDSPPDPLPRAQADAQPGSAWVRFVAHLGPAGLASLEQHARDLSRQVHDDGVSYNAESGAPQRPWPLEVLPLPIPPAQWQALERGVLQRTRLLDRILADLYGPQTLLARNLLPPALVHGHPGYLRTLQGLQPPGGTFLHIAAFDLAQDPGGQWWVVSQRTQAPAGLGYLLENRLLVGRQFPGALRTLQVRGLAETYRALAGALRRMSPAGGDARIVLLTPGPRHETHFEHAVLARSLGLPLVEGSDLAVQEQRLVLRTLRGLEPVHGLLKWLDDEFLDPLELRPDSRLGVPGLLQVLRAGHVLVANTPGSALLESAALPGFLPAIARELTGDALALPSVPSWWCGERAAMHDALPRLGTSLIRTSQGGPGEDAVPGRHLSALQRADWAERIATDPDHHVLQAEPALSTTPVWADGQLQARALLLRVFVVCDGPQSWRVLPGGLARIAADGLAFAAAQRGGSSADVWVLGGGQDSPPEDGPRPAAAVQPGSLPRRAAENLFWLGRYAERTASVARLVQQILQHLGEPGPCAPPVLAWLDALAAEHGLVAAGAPAATVSRNGFVHALRAGLADAGRATGLGFNLGALRDAAAAVRERLPSRHGGLLAQAEQAFLRDCGPDADGALQALIARMDDLAALQGGMEACDDGLRLLAAGRQLERLATQASLLASAIETEAVQHASGRDLLVALCDSNGAAAQDAPQLLQRLVADVLARTAQALRLQLQALEAGVPGRALADAVPDPRDGPLDALVPLLRRCADAAFQLSDELGARCFGHAPAPAQSVGA